MMDTRLCVLLLWVSLTQCLAKPSTCGKTGDINNIGILSHALPVLTGNFSFGKLSSVCYENVRKSLEELKTSVNEGDPCLKKATAVTYELKSICSTLTKVYKFSTTFQNSLKILDQIHKAMDYISKFAEIIPAVGKMHKLVMEKILPMAMEALGFAYNGVRNLAVYFNKFLGQTESSHLQKLLIEINKKGTRACTESTSMGANLTKLEGDLKTSSESSKVILQAFFEIQECANKECPSSAEACLECWKLNNNFANILPLITKYKEGMQVCSTKMNDIIKQLNLTTKLDAIFEIGFNTIKEVEQFLKIFSGSLDKSLQSIAPVAKHLTVCCPCGRPNLKECDEKAIKKSTGSVKCPLEFLINFSFTKLLNSIEKKLRKLRFTIFPPINFDIQIPSAKFEMDTPKYVEQCFGSSTFQMKFTKLCSLPNKQFVMKFHAPILSGLTHASMTATYGSLPREIKESCIKTLESFKYFGRTMTECVDRIAIATSICGRIYSDQDPDPGVDYCPCQIPAEKADVKQPYCVIWKKSDLKTCSSHCLEKGYKPGKDPSGHNSQMGKTYGYPVCDNLKYYCKISDVRVSNGKVNCENDYTFHDSKCRITPNPGYICPVNVIECGSSGDPIKGVCWNYRFIECSKDNGNHFPVCTCSNVNSFYDGTLLCQYGNSQGAASTPASALELRTTSNCFERLGLDADVKTDCGSFMSPCVINKRPTVEPYQTCNYDLLNNKDAIKASQITEEYKGNVKDGGIFLISFAAIVIALLLSEGIFYVIYYKDTDENDETIQTILLIIFSVLLCLLLILIIPASLLLTNTEIFFLPGREIVFFSIFGGACFLLIIFLAIVLLCGQWESLENCKEKILLTVWLLLFEIMIICLILGIVCVAKPDMPTRNKESLIYLKVGNATL